MLIWAAVEQHVAEHRAEFACFVTTVFPVHTATQIVVKDILAFRRQRAYRFVAPYELAILVGDVFSLGLVAPLMTIPLWQHACAQEFIYTRILSPAFAIERHAHHEFFFGYTGLQVGFHSLRARAVT